MRLTVTLDVQARGQQPAYADRDHHVVHWPGLTTTADHNKAGQRPTRTDRTKAESQASDGNRQRARTLQAEGQGFESPKLHLEVFTFR